MLPSLLLFIAWTGSGSAKPRADLSRFIAVGDSLTAGVQNIGLEASQQGTGYSAVIARQAGVQFTLPLVEFPGAPAYLTIYQSGAFPVIGPVAPPKSVGRINPLERPSNLAVPSFTVADALRYRPNASTPPSLSDRGPLVLGMPGPFTNPGIQACQVPDPPATCIGKTMIELAKEANPTTILVWLGNNDALIAALFGNLNLLTPGNTFKADFSQVMSELESTGGTLVVGTIPDITSIPFFVPVKDIADQYALSKEQLRNDLNLAPGDYVRRSALPVIDAIVRRTQAGPLPEICAAPIYVLPAVPCRLTEGHVALLQDRIKTFNQIITQQTRTRKGVLVDTNKLVNQIAKKGYMVGNELLTTRFLGGLFSLDGVHPTATGYAVIANHFIERMNAELQLSIPKVSVEAVWAADPLKKWAIVETVGKR